MTSPLRALAAVALLTFAGFAFFACGDDPEPAAPPAAPAPAPSDTGATARAAFAAFFRPGSDRIPHELATNPGTPWGDYVGSKACKSCHEKDYADWRDSFHSRTLYDVHPKTVIGDFSGKAGTYDNPKYNLAVRPYQENGRYYMEIKEKRIGAERSPWTPAIETGTFEIIYAFGNRRHQPYVARATDGRYVVPPIFWDDAKHAWDWDGWRPYVQSCAHCHVTGIKTSDERVGNAVRLGPTHSKEQEKWSPPSKDEGWAEGAVGCEVCHGPGKGHVDTTTKMGAEAYRAYLANGGAPTIYNPKHDTPEHRMQQCDQCHNFFTESQITFYPRPTGYPYEPFTERLADPKQFHANGTDMSPCTVGHVLRHSKMGLKGVECRDCHASHGNAHWAELTEPIEDNRLCLKCHQTDASGAFKDTAAVAKHARHQADGPGVLCVECHMPRDKHFSNGIVTMAAELHSHAMSIPTGYENERGGPPSSCNLCHVDRDALWTRKKLEAWHRGETPPK